MCSWDHGGWGWEEREVWQCEGKPSTPLSCVLKLALSDEGTVSWKQKETKKVTEEGKKEGSKEETKEGKNRIRGILNNWTSEIKSN